MERDGVFREGELEITDSAGCDFIGQRAVGDGLKHCNRGAEGGLLVLEVEVCVDLISVGLSELGLGNILAVDVGGGGCEGRWPLLAESAQARKR